MPAVILFDVFIVVVVVVVVILGLTYFVVTIAASLDAPPPLSMRRRLSRCAAASIATPPPTQRHGIKGLMWGARGQFPPAAAMVVMSVLGRWFMSAHVYFWNCTYFLQNKNGLGLNYLDSLKFRHHVPPPRLIFFFFRK